MSFIAAGMYGGLADKMPEKFVKYMQDSKIPSQMTSARCFPFNDVLAAIGVDHIDYLNLDIEGPEAEVLESVDWSRTTIDMMTVEIHGDEKKLAAIRQLMTRVGGYSEVGMEGLDVVFERTDRRSTSGPVQ